MSKKHVKGEKGTPFSRCLKAAAKLRQTRAGLTGGIRAFDLVERESSPGCRRIEIAGELDLAVAARLRQALRRAERSRRVLIDLQRCDFIDLATLALLVRAGRDGQAADRWVTVHGARGQPLRLFEVLGLAEGLVLQGARRPLARIVAGQAPELGSSAAPVHRPVDGRVPFAAGDQPAVDG